MANRSVTCVFVASRIQDLAKQVQRQLPSVRVEELQVNDANENGQLAEGKQQLQKVEVVLSDSDVLLELLKADSVPSLKWVHSTWAGLDTLLKGLDQQKPKQDFILTRSADAFPDVMGQYVIGQIIARERDFAGMKAAQENREFSNRFHVFRPLSTLSIGILGYGAIGKRVAEICKFMGMTVWAINRTANSSTSPHVDYFRGMDTLGEVLQNVDYLCSILPHTPASVDLLSGEVLKQCQTKKTVLINIGRGSVINDKSLARALREGWLGGAILDVFNQEPLPADSELWTLPNVTITPHMSGPSLPELVAASFAKNFKLHTSGQPLQFVFDWQKGY